MNLRFVIPCVAVSIGLCAVACGTDRGARSPSSRSANGPGSDQEQSLSYGQNGPENSGNGFDRSRTAAPQSNDTGAGSTERMAPDEAAGDGRASYAADRGTSESDRGISAAVRREILDDPSLSVIARNVTILTDQGKVTLLGWVKSLEQKTAIDAYTRRTQGVSEIDDRIEVR